MDEGALDIGSDGDDDLDSVWEHSQGESQDWLHEAEAELSNAIQVNAAVAAAVLPPRARLNSRVLLPDPEDVGDALPMNRDASDLAGRGNVTMKIGDQDAEAIAKRVPNTEQASRISSRTSHSGATALAPSSPHGPAPGGIVEGGGGIGGMFVFVHAVVSVLVCIHARFCRQKQVFVCVHATV